MTREQALAMGQTKAMAMVTLSAATPEDDTAAGLYRKKSVALPGGSRGRGATCASSTSLSRRSTC